MADLIHLHGNGNTITLRITGQAGPGDLLDAQIHVETPFVTARVSTALGKEALDSWRDALDLLDAGHDAVWDTGLDGVAVSVEHAEDDRLAVTISDEQSLVDLTVRVLPEQDWFDGAYALLDQVWQKWFGSAEQP